MDNSALEKTLTAESIVESGVLIRLIIHFPQADFLCLLINAGYVNMQFVLFIFGCSPQWRRGRVLPRRQILNFSLGLKLEGKVG